MSLHGVIRAFSADHAASQISHEFASQAAGLPSATRWDPDHEWGYSIRELPTPTNEEPDKP